MPRSQGTGNVTEYDPLSVEVRKARALGQLPGAGSTGKGDEEMNPGEAPEKRMGRCLSRKLPPPPGKGRGQKGKRWGPSGLTAQR